MKKLILIAVLFCLSALLFKTEAEEIKDKDFIEFFTNFQKDLKEYNGKFWGYSQYIDFESLTKESEDNYFSFNLFGNIISYIQADYNIICKLSKKNKYCQSTKNNYYSKYTYSYHIWRLDYYDGYYYLTCLSKYVDTKYDESEEGSLSCTFKKVDGEWKIVSISQAG